MGYTGGAYRERNARGNYGNTRRDKRGDIRWIDLGYTGEAHREGNAREMYGRQRRDIRGTTQTEQGVLDKRTHQKDLL